MICTGIWSHQFGRRNGIAVPVHPCEHFYVVTEPIEGVTPDLPVMRDPDGQVYFKEEVGGLVMGGTELVAKPWVSGCHCYRRDVWSRRGVRFDHHRPQSGPFART